PLRLVSRLQPIRIGDRLGQHRVGNFAVRGRGDADDPCNGHIGKSDSEIDDHVARHRCRRGHSGEIEYAGGSPVEAEGDAFDRDRAHHCITGLHHEELRVAPSIFRARNPDARVTHRMISPAVTVPMFATESFSTPSSNTKGVPVPDPSVMTTWSASSAIRLLELP